MKELYDYPKYSAPSSEGAATLLHEHRPTEPAVREWAWHYGRGIMGVHCNSGYTVWYIEFGHLVEDYP